MHTDKTVVLVTGGAKRVGKAIVENLAADGFAVAIHCNHSLDEGEALLKTVVATGGTAVLVQADLTNSDAVRRLVGSTQDALGPVQILSIMLRSFTKMGLVTLMMSDGTGILQCM